MKMIRMLNIKKTFAGLRTDKEDLKLLINILLCMIVPFLFLLAIEFVGQRGKLLPFLTTYKQAAILNYLLLLIVVSPAILAKRTHFMAFLLGIPWGVLAVVSAVLMKLRGMPFSWADMYSANEGAAIANQYISRALMIKLAVAAVVTLLILAGCFIIRFKTYRVHILKRVIVFVLLIGTALLGRDYLLKHEAVVLNDWDAARAYQENGFIYSFVQSYLDTFHKKADDYSTANVQKVVDNVTSTQEDNSERPNVIMVQTEAFCDPTVFKGTQFNEEPIPNFRKYYTEGYSGHLQVPTIGGGTVRTEFEVLTGFDLDYMAPGEIPYNSGLMDKGPVESIAYVMKNQQYKTTAIHNFEGNFYSRNKVFRDLGFDRFIPMETMHNIVKYRGFPEDHVLLEYIRRSLNTTPERDFILTITAGTHGPYDANASATNQKFVSGPLPATMLHQLQNYTALVKRTDRFIGDLAEYVYSLDEPTILVVYSDHYPKLDATDSLGQEEKFETPYFIIDNRKSLPKSQGNDMEAYQLSTQVLDFAHLKGGIMNHVHEVYKNDANYQENLKLVQYDLLYGKKYAENGVNPYQPTDIQIGIDKLEVKNTDYTDGTLTVKGTGFTKSSKVFLDGKPIYTKFMSENELSAKGAAQNFKTVQVKQLGRKNVPILDSNIYEAAGK